MYRALIVALLSVSIIVAADDKPVRELTVKSKAVDRDFKLNGVEIVDAEGLKKLIKDEGILKGISDGVDFKKEKVVVFAWSGSGGDRLFFKLAADEKSVKFEKLQGATDDIRYHLKVFVVKVGIKVEK